MNTGNDFFPFWKKYRPVILKMMVDSAEEPQKYKFGRHELSDVDSNRSTTYPFVLEVDQGKSLHPKKTSLVAQDLLIMLKHSSKGIQLMENALYEFKLDKHFVLHVELLDANVNKEEETTEESEVSEEPQNPEKQETSES